MFISSMQKMKMLDLTIEWRKKIKFIFLLSIFDTLKSITRTFTRETREGKNGL